MKTSIAIIGAGNIGLAIAKGLVCSKKIQPHQITLTSRHKNKLNHIQKSGFNISENNKKTIQVSEIIQMKSKIYSQRSNLLFLLFLALI